MQLHDYRAECGWEERKGNKCRQLQQKHVTRIGPLGGWGVVGGWKKNEQYYTVAEQTNKCMPNAEQPHKERETSAERL